MPATPRTSAPTRSPAPPPTRCGADLPALVLQGQENNSLDANKENFANSSIFLGSMKTPFYHVK
jgi:hypothetical protein